MTSRRRSGARRRSNKDQHSKRVAGVGLIVLYKATKALAELSGALAMIALAAAGELDAVRSLGHDLRTHVASRWSLEVGRLLLALTSPRGARLVELGLGLDGLLSAVEGWALWTGRRWGEWLVVVASAAPIPLEIREIAHHPTASRILLALVNLAVIAYLASRILRRRMA